ncbi:MAG: hypothetical protein QXS27_06595 [Candidatus Jordarchaeaceae archaeon]
MEKELEMFLKGEGIWSQPLTKPLPRPETATSHKIRSQIVKELKEAKNSIALAAVTITLTVTANMIYTALLSAQTSLDIFTFIFLNNILVAFAICFFKATVANLNKKLEWPMTIVAFIFIAIVRPLLTIGVWNFVKLWTSEWGWIIAEMGGVAGIGFGGWILKPCKSKKYKIFRFEGYTQARNYTTVDGYLVAVFITFIAIVAAIKL